jgi:acyl-CoA reductase-like NAD-dependent aldehyde dehydrogenase
MDAAERAFRTSWWHDENRRRQSLRAAASAIRDHAEELIELLVMEQGKPRGQAKDQDVGALAAWFDWAAVQPLPGEVLRDTDTERVEIRYHPVGVVAAITPWNFPLLIAGAKLAPSLIMGNTVVLKPSPYTPLTTLRVGEILCDVFPPGVLNVVSGGNELGAWMTTHSTVRKISFTGSVATGKKVLRAAVDDLKRVTLELGGNDPAIVLDDVDPRQVAETLFWQAFNNCGQVCVAVKRIYVHERVYPALLSELARQAQAARVGSGLDPETMIGPLNNQMQFERVSELVADARDSGAEFVAGGAPLDRPGYFFAPTIVTEVTPHTRLVAEEQFGPAVPVIPFNDLDEAIAQANDTHFGLGGVVWSGNYERGIDVAARIESGVTSVNGGGAFQFDLPWGGLKWSGLGRENGAWGLKSMSEVKSIVVNKG